MADLFYQGTQLRWTGHGEFKATSGLKGHQNASEQTNQEHGPIPEGEYWFPVHVAKTPIATMIAPGQLDRNDGIEFVSPLIVHGTKIYDLTAWGLDRVRLHVTRIDDPKARHRDGFYLHDSAKGYSHGCIEVEMRFFFQLRAYAATPGKRKMLRLRVKYPVKDASTYGGTDRL